MPDYNLSGLSSRSFEQLVQALSVKVLGPGTVIFGDGPDGGREATFEGRVPYPNNTNGWNGYILVQAKFKQRLEGTTKDGEWAVKQLTDELEKFISGKLRKPEFYIFCTNVVLTPKHRTGAKDRIAAVFAKYQKPLGLLGHDSWDYDKLRVFLDNDSDVRHAFAAWITPGDVLASIVAHIQGLKPDFQKCISAFLQKELLADQYVNLDQAGHSTEEQIPMARVFVDLMSTPQPLPDVPQEENDQQIESQVGFVQEVLKAGSCRLNEEPGTPQRESTTRAADPAQADLGRFVLIGGPGQGKSTTAQYLCQVYRVALLSEGQRGLSAECKATMNLIQKHCSAEALPPPGARRFPFRVLLNDFAKELASDRSDAPRSLLAYIAHRIRLRKNSDLTRDNIKEWLANYPWFLVLDGLDEVPASSNRNQVLSAITDFSVDVATNRGDLLVLATTRPQGYSRDFSPDFYAHRYLSPLSVKHALRYADRLTEARFGHDVERKKRVMERLNNASTVESTARLMTSPLQVTIMATLVDRAGQPPPERWRLFSEYYDVIYKREMERDNPAARILRNYKTNIDGIHQLAGLELQTEGERTGRTDARLSKENFTGIVKLRLTNEGYTGPELDRLSNSITDAATQRLVFLVGIETDQIGFEIRSLQEFMAAEALMEGADGQISDRLKAIAPITYWRNVFLFAAGKCFTHRQHLRDSVVSVCENLNEESDLDHVILTGSEIALDLVRDGTARQHPKFQNRLTRLACRLIDRPCSSVHHLLADSHYDAIDSVFREELPKGFPSGSSSDQSGAVCTAAWLTIRGLPWAAELADSNWPKEGAHQSMILRRLLTAGRHSWLERKIVQFISGSVHIPWSLVGLQKLVPQVWEKALGLVFGETEASKSFRFLEQSDSPGRFFCQVILCGDGKIGQSLVELPADLPIWKPFRDCGKYLLNPTKTELGHWLNAVAEVADWESIQDLRWPWPLRSCLGLATSQDSLRTLADQAIAGEFGDRDDWLAAEARWARGVTPDDFLAFDRNSARIGPYLKQVGFPVDTLGTSAIPGPELKSVLTTFLTMFENLRYPAVRSAVASSTLFIASLLSRDSSIPSALLRNPKGALDLANEAASGGCSINLDGLIGLAAGQTSDEWLTAFNDIGHLSPLNVWGPNKGRSKFAADVRDAFVRDQSRRGLARVLGRIASGALGEVDGDNLQIPLAVLNKLNWTDSPFRLNLVYLRLVNADLSEDEAAGLAQELARLSDDYEYYVANCLAIARRRLSSKANERLALELCRALPGSSWEARSASYEALNDLLRQHHSTLGDSLTREKLGLPKSVA